MKLKNKQTGEIVDFKVHKYIGLSDDGNSVYEPFNGSIDEWEDVPEEPKTCWYLDCNGEPTEKSEIANYYNPAMKEIGNYFKTKEEAEQVVEKLKAWKRLRDKGFRFDVVPALGHCDDEKFDISIMANMPIKWWYNDKVVDDIHYVFGGEE